MTIHGQFPECLERKDRILRELIQLICSCREVQRVAELHKRRRPQLTRLIDEEFVASDAISWGQGKFSWLEIVLLDCSARNQQTTF